MKKVTDDVMHLTAKGENGILTNFKLESVARRYEKLTLTDSDTRRVADLIAAYHAANKEMARAFMKKQEFNKRQLKLLYKLIKTAIIRQGFISHTTLSRFKFNKADLVEKITYRNLIEEFISDKIIGYQNRLIQAALSNEADKGEYLDIEELNREAYALNWKLKQLDGSGELPQEEIDAGNLKLAEINKNIRKKICSRSKIENLCYFIYHNQMRPGEKSLDSKKFLSLGTSNLERIVSFYCQIMNAHNAKQIQLKRKSDKSLKTNINYVPKKLFTANAKRKMVEDLKAKGKTQKEIAVKIGCSERTVRAYWK